MLWRDAILAVGNSDHILTYRGPDFWADSVEWARWTDFKPVSDRTLTYVQIAAIVRTLMERAATLGIRIKVYDQIDPGKEFNSERFKYERHPECADRQWDSLDIRARLTGGRVCPPREDRDQVPGPDRRNRLLRQR